VTTDGFITNVSDLEERLSQNYLMQEYKKIRSVLSDNDIGIELKSKGKGIIA
jgi:hypothetical protein